MHRRFFAGTNSIMLLFLAIVLAGCVSQGSLQPFTTDGCSLFPDRALNGKADWCQCCVAHDLEYWRGGTAEARRNADQKLRECVVNTTNNKLLADAMYAGVRSGGGPYFFTPYRWGYGWPYGRPYRELTPDEAALASELERNYRNGNPSLTCQGQ